jgi:succinate dehydrogenase flavin-adding protein (antitoxin of CptAB toxin-antitoxin module)
MQADSGNMIAGWREIGRMCGYYAPEVKKIDVNITAKRAIDKLETLSDEDLLQMIEDSSQIIEAEAVEILDELQTQSDQADQAN